MSSQQSPDIPLTDIKSETAKSGSSDVDSATATASKPRFWLSTGTDNSNHPIASQFDRLPDGTWEAMRDDENKDKGTLNGESPTIAYGGECHCNTATAQSSSVKGGVTQEYNSTGQMTYLPQDGCTNKSHNRNQNGIITGNGGWTNDDDPGYWVECYHDYQEECDLPLPARICLGCTLDCAGIGPICALWSTASTRYQRKQKQKELDGEEVEESCCCGTQYWCGNHDACCCEKVDMSKAPNRGQYLQQRRQSRRAQGLGTHGAAVGCCLCACAAD